MSLLFLGVEFLGLCGQEKNILFTEATMERREALSIPERSGAGTGPKASTARFSFLRRTELHKRD
jgi:hypothetical protein